MPTLPTPFDRISGPSQQWWFDGVLAASFVGGVLLFASYGTDDGAATVVVGVIGAGTILVRRASPMLALAGSWLAAILQMALAQPPSFLNVATLMVVYACAAFGDRLARRLAAVSCALGALIAGVYLTFVYVPLIEGTIGGATPEEPNLLLGAFSTGSILLTLAVAWLAGLVRFLVLRSQEARVAQRIAEVESRRAAELMSVERERARIAREMHDVLAHSLVTIATLADGARYAVRRDQEAAEQAVRTIGTVSRDALGDVRRLLSELRHEQEAAPISSLQELPELIEQFRGLGLALRLHTEGVPLPVSTGVSLAAYRVVQESLTNALRHGDITQPVQVVLRWRPGQLQVLVHSALRPVKDGPPAASGHGLRGMRERVLLEGGTFEAGLLDRSFTVQAALPTQAAARTLAPVHTTAPEREAE